MQGHRGFTLVELVMVIVLLGLVAMISVRFVSLSTQGALDLGSRQQRALQGVVLGEQLSRQLREAFPLSLRTNGACLEWIPLLSATNYRQLTQGPGFDTLAVVPFNPVPPVGSRLVVYGYGSDTSDLYADTDPGPVSGPVSLVAGNSVTLTSPHRFTQQSPERRLFAIGDPVSVCQDGRWLYRYTGYGRSTVQPVPPVGGVREVMSANLAAPVNFQLTPASLQRAAVVAFTLSLKDYDTGSNEVTTTVQEVQVRNVP